MATELATVTEKAFCCTRSTANCHSQPRTSLFGRTWTTAVREQCLCSFCFYSSWCWSWGKQSRPGDPASRQPVLLLPTLIASFPNSVPPLLSCFCLPAAVDWLILKEGRPPLAINSKCCWVWSGSAIEHHCSCLDHHLIMEHPEDALKIHRLLTSPFKQCSLPNYTDASHLQVHSLLTHHSCSFASKGKHWKTNSIKYVIQYNCITTG